MTDAEIENQVAERNSLRAAASLPLLDERDIARLKAARAQAEFEKYFQAFREKYAHLWSDPNRGVLTNGGIYAAFWNRLRRSFDAMPNGFDENFELGRQRLTLPTNKKSEG